MELNQAHKEKTDLFAAGYKIWDTLGEFESDSNDDSKDEEDTPEIKTGFSTVDGFLRLLTNGIFSFWNQLFTFFFGMFSSK